MHPCPCCGHRTLPETGAYDLCPVCWWEDEGVEPWEVSGPNGQTLVEAQQEYLAQRRPYRMRPGGVRAPRRGEERDPDWRPFELTDELTDDPVGPLREYNAAVQTLQTDAGQLPHREVRARLRELSRAHGLDFSDAQVELLARTLSDEGFYRRHPFRAAWWLLRYARPTTVTRRWRELRTGSVLVVG
jgi:hypothetical protein